MPCADSLNFARNRKRPDTDYGDAAGLYIRISRLVFIFAHLLTALLLVTICLPDTPQDRMADNAVVSGPTT